MRLLLVICSLTFLYSLAVPQGSLLGTWESELRQPDYNRIVFNEGGTFTHRVYRPRLEEKKESIFTGHWRLRGDKLLLTYKNGKPPKGGNTTEGIFFTQNNVIDLGETYFPLVYAQKTRLQNALSEKPYNGNLCTIEYVFSDKETLGGFFYVTLVNGPRKEAEKEALTYLRDRGVTKKNAKISIRAVAGLDDGS